MHQAVIFSTFVASAVALPSLLAFNPRQAWSPAPQSVVKCHDSDKIISFFVGPQKETVLNNACAAMLPPCAYQERHADLICPQVMDFALDGCKTSTQNANVEDASNGNKLSGWQVKFSVTPANATNPVMWTKADCYGYFETIVTKTAPDGCFNSMGSGIGNHTVGDGSALKGAVFDLAFVPRE